MMDLEAICHRLRDNAADLTILNLNFEGIGNRGARLLAQALKYNHTLLVLFLDGNDITDARDLAASLSHHPTLQHLFMSYNSIGNEGAKVIAAALRENKKSKLQVLKLANCGIRASGAAALGEALRHNRVLVKLLLESNPDIGVEGAIALAEGLRGNGTLTTLDLKNCLSKQELDAVQLAFLAVLETNKNLNQLVLQGNGSKNLAKNEKDPASLQARLSYYQELNRLGRRWFHSPSIPKGAWPRVLAAATNVDGRMQWQSPQLLCAVVTARPDLIM